MCPSAASLTLSQSHGLLMQTPSWSHRSSGCSQEHLSPGISRSYAPHLFQVSVKCHPVSEAFPDHPTENDDPLHPFIFFFLQLLSPPDIHFYLYFFLYCLSPHHLDNKPNKDTGFCLIYSLLCSQHLEQCLACKLTDT